MPEPLGYQFDRLYAGAIERYRQVATIAERDAIPTGKRWEGMLCYVKGTETDYQLRGGTANGDWIAASDGNFFDLTTNNSDDITEGLINLFLSQADQTKLDYITVTQAVDLDALESAVDALGSGITFIDEWDASSGSFPGGGTAAIGDFYVVSVAGTVDGVSFAIGDGLIAKTTNASTTTFAGNWVKTESTSDVTSVVGLTGVISKSALLAALNVEDGATADQTGAEIVSLINAELTTAGWQTKLTEEEVLDFVGTAMVNGSQIGVQITYDDANDVFDFIVNQYFGVTYGTLATLLIDQSGQNDFTLYEVTDGSGFTSITSGRVWVRYKGTTAGDETDYIIVSAEQWASGGGGSTPLTTKGDILTYDTDNARLPVGTDGQVLTADSTEPKGIKWADASGGSSSLEYQTAITANTTLDGSQKGLNKVYPVSNSAAITITITTGDYVLNDVINIERRGQGTVEIIADTGVFIRGVRDINNRYYINDVNSIVALLCRGSEEFAIIGNLKRGYTGAVTTSSYGVLSEGDTGIDVTVIGTGFSSNMLDPVVSANATLNSWTYVSNTEITLNLDAVGSESDTVTVTYDNGDVFVDTDCITIAASVTAGLIAYLRFNNDVTDATGNHTPTSANITYANGIYSGNANEAAEFNGDGDTVQIPDAASLSFGNGTTDSPFTFTFCINADNLGISDGGTFSKYFVAKRGDSGSNEYLIATTNDSNRYVRCILYDQSTSGNITRVGTTALSNSTNYHISVTYDGSGTVAGIKIYIDGVEESSYTDASSGTYVAMENGTAPVQIGYGLISALVNYDGRMDGFGIWNLEKSQSEITTISAKQISGLELL